MRHRKTTIPADKDVIHSNGVLMIVRTGRKDWPFAVQGYYDLDGVKDVYRLARDEESAREHYKHILRARNKQHPELKIASRSFLQGSRKGMLPVALKEAEKNAAMKTAAIREADKRVKVRAMRKLGRDKVNKAKGDMEKAKWSVADFHCVFVTPWAFVWKAVRNARWAAMDHKTGEFMITVWNEPVRDENGKITVYKNWAEAQAIAMDMWRESKWFTHWKYDTPYRNIIFQGANGRVIFDPQHAGTPQFPFIATNFLHKPILTRRKENRFARKQKLVTKDMPDELKAELQLKNRRYQMQRALSEGWFGSYKLGDYPEKFRTPWAALEAINEIASYYKRPVIDGLPNAVCEDED